MNQPLLKPQDMMLTAAPARNASGFALMDTCRFHLRTIEEAETAAATAANMFRDPVRAQAGLRALLLNAVEHGVLEIGHALKSRLVADGLWAEEIARRESLPENRRKTIEFVLSRKPDGIFAVVTDPGAGFDWRTWLTVDPARAGAIAGRGIARARSASFDALSYNEAGNQAVGFIKDEGGMAW